MIRHSHNAPYGLQVCNQLCWAFLATPLLSGDVDPVVVKDVHVLVEAEVAVLVLVRLRERLLHLIPLPAVEPLLEHLFANNIVATVSKIMLLETNNLLHFNEVRFARLGFAEFASLNVTRSINRVLLFYSHTFFLGVFM